METPDKLELILEGPNGSIYHISGGELQAAEGVGLGDGEAGTAFEDMFEAPFETIYNSTAYEIGGRYGGTKENMIEFSLVFHLKPVANLPWRIVWSRFRKAIDSKRDSKIRARIPGVSERWLNVRMRNHSKLQVVHDPNRQKYGKVMVHFVAPYPRWIEDDFTDTYITTTDTRSSGTEIGSVWVSNPTNNEIWLKWMCQAGNAGVTWTLPDFSFGDDRWDRPDTDDDRMVEMPELILGEHIAVDTDELTLQGQVNSSLDTQVYQRMNSREFLYPIPAYTEPIELPVVVKKADIGNGIQVRCPRAWSTPWGLE